MSTAAFLEKRTMRNFKLGSTVFKEGDEGHSMFIIIAGLVQVSTNIDGKKIILAHLKQGDIFGEMALFGDKIRSATVIAETDLICHEINRVMFNKQMESLSGTMKTFFSILVERLKESNKRQKTSGPDDVKRQVVYLLNFLLQKDGEEHLGGKFLYFNKVASDIAFIANIKEDQVEKIITQLTQLNMAKSKTAGAHERVFLVENLEIFNEFSEFCRSKADKKHGLSSASEMFRSMSDEEKEVLMLVRRFLQKSDTPGDTIREDLFRTQLEMQSGKPFDSYANIIKNASANDILKFVLDDKKERMIRVNRDLLMKRLQSSDRLQLFIDTEGKLG